MWLLPIVGALRFFFFSCLGLLYISSEKSKKEWRTLPHPTAICCKFSQLCIVLHRLTYSHPSGWQKRAKLVRPQPFWPTSCISDRVHFLFQQRPKNWEQWKVSNCLVFITATIDTSNLCINLTPDSHSCKSQKWMQDYAQYGSKRWSLQSSCKLQQHSRADRFFASPLHLTLLLHLMPIF